MIVGEFGEKILMIYMFLRLLFPYPRYVLSLDKSILLKTLRFMISFLSRKEEIVGTDCDTIQQKTKRWMQLYEIM